MTRTTIKNATSAQLEARLNELDAKSAEEFEGEYARIMNEQDDRYFARRNQAT
jgi:hypothetical protein